jgi:hypothetical protein
MPRKSATRPQLFVGSSKESLRYAYSIQQNLDRVADVTVWDQNIFRLSKSSLESLLDVLPKVDFAVLVFAPDDALRLRKHNLRAVRDNVVFELGLFIGALGRERTFMVVPQASERLRTPTDLLGITPGTFNPARKDKNLRAAFGPFCNEVWNEMRTLGPKRVSKRAKRRVGSRPKGDLFIVKAEYGSEELHVDVTKRLNDAISRNSLTIFASNNLAGDPCPNVPKNLFVKYRYKGQELTKTVPETAMLFLP